MLPAPLWIPTCSPNAHCPATVLLSLLLVQVGRQSMALVVLDVYSKGIARKLLELNEGQWQEALVCNCLRREALPGRWRRQESPEKLFSPGSIHVDSVVGHCPLSKSLLQQKPSQRGLLLLAEVVHMPLLCSCSSFSFFLTVTSVLCFLSFRMFPNTSCLVRCLRQTERCCWRLCFIAQFVH